MSALRLRAAGPALVLRSSTRVKACTAIGLVWRPNAARAAHTYKYLPTIAQPSFWSSIIPGFKHKDTEEPAEPVKPKKERNPATFFIWMFLLIGSQAINHMSLKRDIDNFSKETTAKLDLLRDVVKRLKSGEAIDVDMELGTGNEKMEKEWEAGA